MPASVLNTLDNVTSVKPRSYIALIIIYIIIIFIIFSQRLFNIQSTYYYMFEIFVLTIISFIIVLSIIVKNIDYGENKFLDAFSETFNTIGSKNFFAILSLVLFIMFVYEVPLYSNNQKNQIVDILTRGHNSYVSNKSMGLFWIVATTLYISTTIFITTL